MTDEHIEKIILVVERRKQIAKVLRNIIKNIVKAGGKDAEN